MYMYIERDVLSMMAKFIYVKTSTKARAEEFRRTQYRVLNNFGNCFASARKLSKSHYTKQIIPDNSVIAIVIAD